MISFIKESWKFLSERKIYWLFLIVITLTFLGYLIVLSQGLATSPFTYTVF